ncbi:hypothetical protein ARTHRO8AJ_120022 [Arthrobacter sp. 8AJ]|nr:hypothetical protein ARTHRO8AJ_120022 [Arthrobacter sp. 8AJ]
MPLPQVPPRTFSNSLPSSRAYRGRTQASLLGGLWIGEIADSGTNTNPLSLFVQGPESGRITPAGPATCTGHAVRWQTAPPRCSLRKSGRTTRRGTSG